MRIRFLGSGTAYNADARASQAILMEPPGTTPFLVDAGLDLNGRTGLEALGTTATFDAAGGDPAVRGETAIEDAARRNGGLYASLDGPVLERLTA